MNTYMQDENKEKNNKNIPQKDVRRLLFFKNDRQNNHEKKNHRGGNLGKLY